MQQAHNDVRKNILKIYFLLFFAKNPKNMIMKNYLNENKLKLKTRNKLRRKKNRQNF